MTLGQNTDAAPEGNLHQFLLREKEAIIRTWQERVLADPTVPEAARVSEPELRNHVPELIDQLANLLETGEHAAASRALVARQLEVHANEHASARISQSYSLGSVMREWSHLRAAVLRLCSEGGVQLGPRESWKFHTAVDDAMATIALGVHDASQAEIAKQNQQLKLEAEFRERFIAILGHDLKNPLSTIVMAVSILLRSDSRPETYQVTLQRVSNSAHRMVRMIQDLLDVSQSRLGDGIPISPRASDLGVIALQVRDEHEVLHPGRTQLTIEGDVTGMLDPDRMAQVLSNLVANGLKYGDPERPVEVLVSGGQELLLVHVKSEGAAIPEAELGLVFEPFRRASRATGEGLGLGLYITQQIVIAHGGEVSVRSSAEEGTVFTVTLPRSAAAGSAG